MTSLWQCVIGGAVLLAAASGSALGAQPPQWSACAQASWEKFTCINGGRYFCRFKRDASCRVVKQCRVVVGTC
jgi:hypothetical protein